LRLAGMIITLMDLCELDVKVLGEGLKAWRKAGYRVEDR
jgi:hypothetical protein